MNVLLVSIAVATLGVDYGWRRLPDGGTEYIIQLDRLSLDALRDGQPILSDVPPAAGEVRSYRIVVGDEVLPRDTPTKKPPQPLAPDPTIKPLAGRQTSYVQPDDKPPPATKAAPEQSAKPWLPFTLTLIGLFASLGANVYLGWISWGLRQRRRAEYAAESSHAAALKSSASSTTSSSASSSPSHNESSSI